MLLEFRNLKINGKLYNNENTNKTLYQQQEPSLLEGQEEYWINEGDSVTLLASVKGSDGLTIQDSSFTRPNGSPIANNLTVTTLKGEEYYTVALTEDMRPSNAGRVDWNYGGKIYEFSSTIGEGFSLDKATVYDGAKGDDFRTKVREQIDESFLKALMTAKPTIVMPVDGTVPMGTSSLNAFVYSPLNPAIDPEDINTTRDLYKGEIFFTRPGRYLMKWNLDPSKFNVGLTGLQQLVIEVNVKWPEKPYYYHIAETNDVDLDRFTTDQTFFKALQLSEEYKYISDNNYTAIRATVNDIKINENKLFSFPVWNSKTKENIYRSVLLFTESNDTTATGDLKVEEVKVRVVESRHWSNTRGAYPFVDKEVTIGEEIVDANHSVVEHTGCIIKSKELENARYNLNTYDPKTLDGNIFAVNTEIGENASTDGKNDLVVAWYKEYSKEGGIEWPYRAMRYTPKWPNINSTQRIVVASRLGSDGKDTLDKRQFELDPSKYSKFKVYNQPDVNKTGYNPNEEHAFLSPSFYHSTKTPKPQAVFALRNDLNIRDISDINYTSQPYVLLEYMENNTSDYKMALYRVEISDSNTTDIHSSYMIDKNGDGKVDTLDGNGSFSYIFSYPMFAGDKVKAPYPLDTVIGASTINEISGSNGSSNRKVYWEDKDGNSWTIAGGGAFSISFWYPMRDSFWHPTAKVGDIVPFSYESKGFVSNGKNYQSFEDKIDVVYNTYWKINIPELRMGETLTFAGGEEKKDNTKANGLPSAVAWASAEVLFDTRNEEQNSKKWLNDYSVRIRPVVREITVELANKDFPEELEPATKLTVNKAGKWFFEELHAGLKQRVYYNQESGKIVLRGILNDRFAGDNKLTASPGGYNYILQPNILTIDDLITLREIKNADKGENAPLQRAFTQLYALSLDPTLSKDDLDKVKFIADKKIVFIEKKPLEKKLIELKITQPLSTSKTYDIPTSSFMSYGSVAQKISFPNHKKKSEENMRNKFSDITLKLKDTANSKISIFMKTMENSTFKKRLIYNEKTKGFRLKVNITSKPVEDTIGAHLKVTAEYLSKDEITTLFKYSGDIPELLHLYALVIHPDFSDFDTLVRERETTTLKIDKPSPKTTLDKEDREIEYAVGLSRFLRDKTNRFLVTKDINSSQTTLALLNGIFPSGLDADDLELVDEKELPYGVTISDVTTRLALTAGGKLVRIKEGRGYIPASSLGVGLGVLTNANLAKPDSDFESSHIVIAENNDPLITGSPIALHIFKVNNRPYRGQIKTVWSDNAFDEKITLRHTGDFGGNVKDLIFEWWYRETDNKEIPPRVYQDPSCPNKITPLDNNISGWSIFNDDRGFEIKGIGRYELVFGKTAGKDVLVDNSFYVRYKHKDDKSATPWSGWAGSGGNLPCNEPQPVYKSQLVEGWVKRVVEKVNVYDARINDFSKDAPASYVSMIRQVGLPYVGDVALNPDKNVIENVGLAELYQTVLNRAKNLSIDAGSPTFTGGVGQALQNASSRISKFYTLLGNEAYKYPN